MAAGRMQVAALAAALALAALAIGCSDATSKTPDGRVKQDGGGQDFALRDLAPPPLDGLTLPDTGGGDGGGTCNFNDGQSCAGGQACPSGQQPINDPQGRCFCRVPCNPQGQSQCGGDKCDRVCVQLIDSGGTPIPGQGACIPDPGNGTGEPCAPSACKQNLRCVGPGNDQAFCRKTCTGPQDCAGYKMVCGELSGGAAKVCVPGENPGGPDVGGDCSDPSTFCKNGLLCDPASNSCVTSCNTDGTPPPATCGPGQSCQKVEDTTASVLIGYGCKAGGADAAVTPADGGAGG